MNRFRITGERLTSLGLVLLAFVPFAGMLWRGEVPAFRDHATYFLPLRWHTAMSLRGGDLPLWNAWNGLGEPWLANPQTGVFYPPAWLFLFLPFATAYVLFLAGHLALLGVTSRALFRRWAGEPAATFGAVVLMLSGPVVSLVDVNNNLASFAWMPLAIRFAFERRAGAPRSAAAIGAVLALSFLGGEPVFAAIAALMVAIALGSVRDWRGVAGAAGWSAALAAVQLLPFLAWIRESDRAAGLDPSEAFRHSMRIGDWIALAISTASPDGRFERIRIAQQFIPSLYVGAPAVILALAAGLGSHRAESPQRRRVLATLLLTFAAVLVLAAAPSVSALEELLVAARFNALRYPARLVPIGALVIAALAAIGLDRLRREPLGSRLGVTFWIALLVGLRFLTVEPLPQPTALLRFGIFLAWIVTFGLIYVAFPRWLEDRRVAALLIALVAADLLASARPFLVSRPFAPVPGPWIERFDPPWRFARVEKARRTARAPRAAQWPLGYVNLYGRQFDFVTPAPVIPSTALGYYEAAITGQREDLVDVASVRWILTDRERLPRGFTPEGESIGRVRAFRNRGALPPVQFHAVEAGATEQGHFDAARAIDARSTMRGAPFALSFDGSSATIRIDAPDSGVVVLNQLAAPGWRVRVDGEHAAPAAMWGIFRAVRVERGVHLIRWRYRPAAFLAGSLVSALAVIALTILSLRRARTSH